MAFTIRWANNNSGPSVVNLYRDTKPLVRTALPAPLATFSAGETEYTDRTAILGTRYYYMTSVTVDGTTLYGAQKNVLIQNRRGMGIVVPEWGDDRFAFYGTVPVDELPSFGEMHPGVMAIMGGDPLVRPQLYKFQLDGKILYLPTTMRFTTSFFTWSALYSAGLVYGVPGPGPEGGHGDLPDADQSGEFEWQGDRYRIRLLRGLTADNESPATALDPAWHGKSHDLSPYTTDCEYNRLIYGIAIAFPVKKKVMSLMKLSNYQILNYGGSWTGKGLHCQEFDPVRKVSLVRGSAVSGTTQVTDNLSMIQHLVLTTTGTWLPVIELIEE